MWPIVFLWILTTVPLFAHPAMKRLSYGRDWYYQSILLNGEEIWKNPNGNGNVIHDRYQTIKTLLQHYERPFTVLDIGANNGFFSLKIAEEFDAVCVMIDGTERLADICTLNTERNKIIYLQKYFTKNDLIELVQREHFDVVIALHVLHHVDDWRGWIDALFQLGDNIIIETPSVNDPVNKFENTKQLARFLTSHLKGTQIGSFHRGNGIYDHMLWFCQDSNSFTVKKAHLGLSPSTFFRFNGAFPKQSYVQEVNASIKKQYGGKKWVLQGVDYYLE